MLRKYLVICFAFFIGWSAVSGQPADRVALRFTKKEVEVLPGKVINLAFFLRNNSADTLRLKPEIEIPESWGLITRPGRQELKPGNKKFLIVSVRIAHDYPVGSYPVVARAVDEAGREFSSGKVMVHVQEVENIEMQLIEQREHVSAGEKITASYMVRNLGNTTKKIYFETSGCDVDGSPDVELAPGESSVISVNKLTPVDIVDSKREYYTLRAYLSGRLVKSIYSSALVFPSTKAKKDLYFRFPVKASFSYLSTNQHDRYESAYQFEVEGSGSLDPEGKHRLEFLARGPNNTNLSFLGLYDQYYVSYANKNLELFVGEKSFSFTPLTESSRFGRGTENKVILNNGLGFGFSYLVPRFYEEIENEMSVFSDFQFNEENRISLYYISKKYHIENDPAHLASVSTEVNPFDKTYLEFEFSRGFVNGKTANAYRANLNSRFSIFHVYGIYYDAGKNYPGYYTNSRFYSGNVSARITQKLSAGFYAKEDFMNAQLDTFFVTAPYSKSMQAMLNYNVASRAYLKLYWRDYEKKDRLSQNKFHYKTKSANLQFSHTLRRFDYDLSGEIGETTNFLLEPGENTQRSYRGTVNMAYNFNSLHSIRAFATWSNINQFVSNDQRSLTAGFSATSRITKNLRANFHIQNAYDIDDYYRNRNLMQLNIDYRFLKKHQLSLRSFYTIFKTRVDDPEFTLSATYSYNFGVPLKQVIAAGEIRGRVTNDAGDPVEGIMVHVLNKTAVSDKNGDFVLKTVPPGRHLLTIDREKLAIDEITSIPPQLEVDVFEDKETRLDFKITKGAKLFGKISLGKSGVNALDVNSVSPGNIIVELSTPTETFRLATDKEGRFSFPLVRPGQVGFRIYTNSVPKGFEAERPETELVLVPGESRDLQITLKSKKRNIIFKSQSLSVSKNGLSKPLKVTKVTNPTRPEPAERDHFYTVQIGAFKKRLPSGSKFLKGEEFYFEKQIDNLHKYFIGRFNSMEEAQKEKIRLRARYKNAFVVVVQNDDVKSLRKFRTNPERR